jgi:hypothetical protein
MAGWRDVPFFSTGIRDKATSYERVSGQPITVGSGNYYFSHTGIRYIFPKTVAGINEFNESAMRYGFLDIRINNNCKKVRR